MEPNIIIFIALTPHATTTPTSWLEVGLQNHALTFTMKVNNQEVTILINNLRDLAQIIMEGMSLGTEIYGRYHWSMMEASYLEPYQPLHPPTPIWDPTHLYTNLIQMPFYPPTTSIPLTPWIQP